ncbi:MAG: response regulator [Niastella sp.]|nr:response regulator [Niastella sp.]
MTMVQEQLHPVRNILLVDDDKDELFIFEMAIKEAGIEAIIAQVLDGELMLQRLHQELPDVIFLDIRFPADDGLMRLQQLRQHTAYCKIPIIIYSTLLTPEEVEMAFQAGANYCLTKSTAIGEMVAHLQHIFCHGALSPRLIKTSA